VQARRGRTLTEARHTLRARVALGSSRVSVSWSRARHWASNWATVYWGFAVFMKRAMLIAISNQKMFWFIVLISNLKITDFGLAKEPGERDEDAIVSPYSRGTLNYMSPESVMNGKISAAMDIWSLGCVIAEMCGEPPLEGMAMKAPDIIPKHISMAGKDFSMRCFIRDPIHRWTAKKLLTHEFLCSNYSQNRILLTDLLMHQNRQCPVVNRH
ncbi:hypothetical protein Godav_013903, partial [Gossypium davidsonii]|nr:hypothetical protein [Gossypium davidsonii]